MKLLITQDIESAALINLCSDPPVINWMPVIMRRVWSHSRAVDLANEDVVPAASVWVDIGQQAE